MACFIKLPNPEEKGVLTFTTVEYADFISKSGKLRNSLSKLKDLWVFGLHHNSSHKNHDFAPDPLFDFHIAGQGDLKSPSGIPFYQIEMDCSNFCPDFFENNDLNHKKFWDVLIIARNVRFKFLDDTLSIARKIFNVKPIRILAIVSHEKLHQKNVGSSEIIENYLKMFNWDERKFFTLMTPSVDYPFPFDLETLSFFYHHSKIFLHTAREERHPRVAAYAWAAGLPVIAPEQVGSLLSEDMKNPPGFWKYETKDKAASNILKALNTPMTEEQTKIYSKNFLSRHNLPRFKNELKKMFSSLKINFTDSRWILSDLDIRLARHHDGIQSRNSIPMTLNELFELIQTIQKFPPLDSRDFEMEMIQENQKEPTSNGTDNFKFSFLKKIFKY
ncbi:MAG: hypothetical protein KGJ58_02655 [Patescibacteria group bacterium]|nr:hypothetical protein [Patescibacteria group bacterium]MDE1988307.1 hypothetical protein [Patescibacteria group bacterium]MDE2218328.1 hypothetical protein [Patescibacteria group bacterium]